MTIRTFLGLQIAASLPPVLPGASLWTPIEFSPFAIWSAESGLSSAEGLATVWESSGTSGHDVVGAGEFRRPAINASALNGKPTLTFDPGPFGTTATADYMNNNDSGALRSVFQNQTGGWVFAVVKRNALDASPVSRGIFVCPNGTDGSTRFIAGLGQAAANRPALLVRRLDGDSTAILEGATAIGTDWAMVMWVMNWGSGDGFIYLNGALDASNTSFTTSGATSNTQSQRSVAIGGYPGDVGATPSAVNHCDADLAELIVSRGVPSAADIDRLFGYAAHHYGLTDRLPADHPYKAAPPLVAPPIPYTGWTPADASATPYAWFISDEPGNTFSAGVYDALSDLSGNGRNAAKLMSPEKQVAGIGGRDVVYLTSNGQGFSVSSSAGFLNNKPGATAAAVYNIVDQAIVRGSTLVLADTSTQNTARFLFMAAGYTAVNTPIFYTRRLDADSSSNVAASSQFPNDTIALSWVDYANNDAALRINGAEVAASTAHGSAGNTAATNSATGVTIGRARPASGTLYDGLVGYLGEVVLWDVALPDAEQKKLEGYLAWTWNKLDNLPVDHPYKSAQPERGPGDPYYADVRSLLLMGGAEASTTFTDEKGIAWTPNGNARIDTSSKKYGSGSYRGDGDNDWLQASDASLAPGTSDFCVETWVRKTGDTIAAANADSILIDYRTAEPSAQLEIDINGRTSAFPQEDRVTVYVNGSVRINGQDLPAASASSGVYRHVAYERIGGVGKLYVDGSASATSYADTNNYSSTNLFLGGRFAATSGDRRSLNGNIDSFRLTVRSGARYGGNFTPGRFLAYGPD